MSRTHPRTEVAFPRKKSVLLTNHRDTDERPTQAASNALIMSALGYLPPPPVYMHTTPTPKPVKTEEGENKNPGSPSKSPSTQSTPSASPNVTKRRRKSAARKVKTTPDVDLNQNESTDGTGLIEPKLETMSDAEDAEIADGSTTGGVKLEMEDGDNASEMADSMTTPKSSKSKSKSKTASSSVPLKKTKNSPITKAKSEKAARKPAPKKVSKPVQAASFEEVGDEASTSPSNSTSMEPLSKESDAIIEPSTPSSPYMDVTSASLPTPSVEGSLAMTRSSRSKRKRTVFSPEHIPKRPKAVKQTPVAEPNPIQSETPNKAVSNSPHAISSPPDSTPNPSESISEPSESIPSPPKPVSNPPKPPERVQTPIKPPVTNAVSPSSSVTSVRCSLLDITPVKPPSPSVLATRRVPPITAGMKVTVLPPVKRFTQYSSNLADNLPSLKNPDTSTYVNSILQVIFTVNGFLEALAEFVDKIHSKDALAFAKMPLIVSLARLHKNRFTTTVTTGYLQAMIDCVNTAGAKFQNHRKDNVSEFVADVFNQIQAEYWAAIAAVNGRRQFASDPVTRFFGYTLRRRFTCKNKSCRFEKVVEERKNCFILPIRENRLKLKDFGIADLLKDSLVEETVDRICDACSENKAVMKPEITHLPENLVFVIRRYTTNNFSDATKLTLEKKVNFLCDDEAEELAIQGTMRQSPCKKPHHPLQTFRVWADDEIDNIMADFIGFRNYCNDEDNLPPEDSLTPVTTLYDSPQIEAAFSSFVKNVTQSEPSAAQVLSELICAHIMKHKDIYAVLTGRSVKGITEYVRRSARGGPFSPSLQIYACSNIFKTIFVVQEGNDFIKFVPAVPMPFKKQMFILDKPLNYFSRGSPMPDTQYLLSAIVSNLGNGLNRPNYASAIRSKPGTWYECRGTDVQPVKERSVISKCSGTAYVVIYSKNACDDESDTEGDSDSTDHTD
uniref:USP domain-containing protein n=1 Tax=Panagrellus redivivus TaxID=6233 RepID=A0A7E4V538_PANRE